MRDAYLASALFVDPLKDDPDEILTRQQEGVPTDQSGPLVGASETTAIKEQMDAAIDAAVSVATALCPDDKASPYLVASVSGFAHVGHDPCGDGVAERVLITVDRMPAPPK